MQSRNHILLSVGILVFLTMVVPVVGQEPQAKKPQAQKPEKQVISVYDIEADASVDIAAAVARAKKDNKRVLVVYGGNWCGWCVKLDEFFKKDRTVARTVRYEYEVVKVDIGRFDKHMKIVEGYGAQLKKEGVPYLTVLDGAGKVVAHQNTGDLEKDDHHDSAKVEEFLQAKKAPPEDAEEVLAAALKQAKKDGRKVLLHLGAPW
ncbi:MAG: thioredoxin family protein [Planctomycetota bacterium]